VHTGSTSDFQREIVQRELPVILDASSSVGASWDAWSATRAQTIVLAAWRVGTDGWAIHASALAA
jgi:hypothetical protein